MDYQEFNSLSKSIKGEFQKIFKELNKSENTVNGFNSRLETAKVQICASESLKIFKLKNTRTKFTMENTEKILRGIWDILKTSSICVTEIPKMRRERSKTNL